MSEFFDLVNAEGQIVVSNVERDDAKQFKDAFMQIAIAVIFNTKGQVLVHERAEKKKVAAKHIDHVCGGLLAGETPEAAALREAAEEVGVVPAALHRVREGINEYGRYRYLLVGIADESPKEDLNPDEVAWAAYHHVDDLATAYKAGIMQFVDGFFEDIEHARQYMIVSERG